MEQQNAEGRVCSDRLSIQDLRHRCLRISTRDRVFGGIFSEELEFRWIDDSDSHFRLSIIRSAASLPERTQ